MKHKFVLAFALLTSRAEPAFGSQTACMFSTDEVPQYYEVEFIGYSDTEPMIVFRSELDSGKGFTLHPENYTLRYLSQKARAVGLKFDNPEDSTMPPSFTLAGVDGRATLKIGPSVIEGDLRCDF